MQVDRVFVLHVELDQSERILRTRLLDDPAILPHHVVTAKIAGTLARNLLALDGARDGPGRVRNQAEDRRSDLGCCGFRLPDNHSSRVDELAVPPIGQPGSGKIDIDARRGRVSLEPPQPLHVDCDGTRSVGV